MFLVDTNVWLELLLDQERAGEVKSFMLSYNPTSLFMTDFCVHSIGIILSQLNKETLYIEFLSDTVENSDVGVISLDISDLKQVVAVRKQFNLDFDDAYQYVAAQKTNLSLISFDTDFDRTERGRKAPSGALQS